MHWGLSTEMVALVIAGAGVLGLIFGVIIVLLCRRSKCCCFANDDSDNNRLVDAQANLVGTSPSSPPRTLPSAARCDGQHFNQHSVGSDGGGGGSIVGIGGGGMIIDEQRGDWGALAPEQQVPYHRFDRQVPEQQQTPPHLLPPPRSINNATTTTTSARTGAPLHYGATFSGVAGHPVYHPASLHVSASASIGQLDTSIESYDKWRSARVQAAAAARGGIGSAEGMDNFFLLHPPPPPPPPLPPPSNASFLHFGQFALPPQGGGAGISGTSVPHSMLSSGTLPHSAFYDAASSSPQPQPLPLLAARSSSGRNSNSNSYSNNNQFARSISVSSSRHNNADSVSDVVPAHNPQKQQQQQRSSSRPPAATPPPQPTTQGPVALMTPEERRMLTTLPIVPTAKTTTEGAIGVVHSVAPPIPGIDGGGRGMDEKQRKQKILDWIGDSNRELSALGGKIEALPPAVIDEMKLLDSETERGEGGSQAASKRLDDGAAGVERRQGGRGGAVSLGSLRFQARPSQQQQQDAFSPASPDVISSVAAVHDSSSTACDQMLLSSASPPARQQQYPQQRGVSTKHIAATAPTPTAQEQGQSQASDPNTTQARERF